MVTLFTVCWRHVDLGGCQSKIRRGRPGDCVGMRLCKMFHFPVGFQIPVHDVTKKGIRVIINDPGRSPTIETPLNADGSLQRWRRMLQLSGCYRALQTQTRRERPTRRSLGIASEEKVGESDFRKLMASAVEQSRCMWLLKYACQWFQN